MTIIFQQGDEFWIEEHRVDHGTVAATTTDGVNFNLDKPGIYLAMSMSQSWTAITDTVLFRATNTAGATPAFGSFQTALRSTVRNQSGNALLTCITTTIVYMRRRGSGN